MNVKLLTITRREYLSRVKTKAFWIGTVALPLLMAAWMVLPTLIMSRARGGLVLVVVDETGTVAPALARELEEGLPRQGRQANLDLEVVAPAADVAAQQEELDRRILADQIDAWLWVSQQGLDENRLEYHGQTVTNLLTLEVLERLVSRVVRQQRLVAAGYDPQQIEQLVTGVSLHKVQVSEAGARADQGLGGLALAIGLFTILYMAIMIYGNMVMHGVLEEKANRVVELVVSTVQPWELMAGKLLGIGAVALTQIGIWLGSAAVLTAPGLMTALAAMPEDVPLPTLSPVLVLHFLAHFLLGFTLYASFYALIGAAFNNPQEAQQLAGFGVIFLVAPWMVFMPVLNDPDGTLAVVSSLIPLFTPLLMMLRIAVKMPPAWQLALGYGLTLALDLFMIWVCARVYRVGILMYGKRPTLREIWRWMRYA
ncbi:MAG TPA: ABC transporter permease [Thermoanaerobaculia bacterium]|nr:ABC transporter permease [Thermoanaerobaculia bacterium]